MSSDCSEKDDMEVADESAIGVVGKDTLSNVNVVQETVTAIFRCPIVENHRLLNNLREELLHKEETIPVNLLVWRSRKKRRRRQRHAADSVRMEIKEIENRLQTLLDGPSVLIERQLRQGSHN